MVGLKLTYKDICTQAEDTYRTLYDRKEWPPARNVKDSRAPPNAFGNIAALDNSPMTRAEVLTLIQSKPRFGSTFSDGSKKQGNCNKCGKPGHWAKECPDNNKQHSTNSRFQRQQTGVQGRQQGGSRPNNDRNARKPGWRSTPPASGAPSTKKVDNHTFHWCATCKRWSTTHATDTHTGGTPRGATPSNSSPAALTAALIQDPSVWVTEAGLRPTVGDMLFVLRNLPVHTKIILTLNLFPVTILFISLMTVILQPVTQFFNSALGQVTWKLIVDVTSKVWDTVLVFLQHRFHVLFAPLLWLFLALTLFWSRGSTDDHLASAPILNPTITRNQRRRHRRNARNLHRRSISQPKRSIRTEGFHRKYPLNLREMGDFIRRPPRRNVHSSRFEPHEFRHMRQNMLRLQNDVSNLTHNLRALQRSDYTHAYVPVMTRPGNPTTWPRQQPVPDVDREGEGQHVRHSGQTDQTSPNSNRFSRARRASNRPHPAPAASGPTIPSSMAYPSPVRSNTPRPARISAHVQMAQLNLTSISSSMNVALHAPSRFRNALSSDSTFPVIWDSGASVTISPNKDDFIGPIASPSTITQLKGIARGLRIEVKVKSDGLFTTPPEDFAT
ncbi:hypothetical protein MHU86_25603 [Fragilaria crotonensis]|nr:hypothetical protein MHU86_25603 [Fragilaria crotonensis]